ncbi:hypothetical protein IW261DRAFT_1426616 [Armillaria novae-zelandiae]|uniref:Uncharacterized protein n=1 Tax=Armillaria novae-zelandiae TaxID=153914 RepID=A0AA39TV82_9AGAR|nr:hypothetical protein IW261DRAFT_1426616 [Armillaria novae-zelandiae]
MVRDRRLRLEKDERHMEASTLLTDFLLNYPAIEFCSQYQGPLCGIPGIERIGPSIISINRGRISGSHPILLRGKDRRSRWVRKDISILFFIISGAACISAFLTSAAPRRRAGGDRKWMSCGPSSVFKFIPHSTTNLSSSVQGFANLQLLPTLSFLFPFVSSVLLLAATSMPATTTSVLAYSFFTAFTKNIPLTVFILVILFIFTIFVIYKTTKLLRVRRDRARWVSKRELSLDLEAKLPSDENSISNAANEQPPPISHLRPKTGDRIRSLHRRLITSSGSAEPIFLPLNVGRGSTSGSDDPSTPGLDVGKYEGGYEEVGSTTSFALGYAPQNQTFRRTTSLSGSQFLPVRLSRFSYPNDYPWTS